MGCFLGEMLQRLEWYLWGMVATRSLWVMATFRQIVISYKSFLLCSIVDVIKLFIYMAAEVLVSLQMNRWNENSNLDRDGQN